MIQINALEVKEIQLKLLMEVKAFCVETGIRYFLTGGTCIGAIRHQGFIPWDDDIDLSMKRKEYERFIHEFNRWSHRYRVVSCYNESKYPYPFAKIYDPNTVVHEANDALKMEMGVNIDLFPIDGMSGIPFLQSLTLSCFSFLKNSIYLKAVPVNQRRNAKKNVILSVSKVLLAPISSNRIAKCMNFLARHLQSPGSTHAGILVWGYGQREIVVREVFDQTIEVTFETQRHSVPLRYDEWMRHIYGDYMQLPPIEKQVTHHMYQAYMKSKEDLS